MMPRFQMCKGPNEGFKTFDFQLKAAFICRKNQFV